MARPEDTAAKGPRLDDLVAQLREAGCVFAEEEAALLRESAADSAELTLHVKRRIAGEPLEVIVGWAEFAGLQVIVEPGVFVPRRRTEALLAAASSLASDGLVVVDLCCGSGAVGAALLARHPGVQLFAADVDPVAVHCAGRNLAPERVFAGDLFEPLPAAICGCVGLIAVNAPYVPSDQIAHLPREARDHEPAVALDGGTDGMDLHRRIIAEAPDWLRPGGHLLIETSERQAPTVVGLMSAAGLTASIARDDDRQATVVIGRAVVC